MNERTKPKANPRPVLHRSVAGEVRAAMMTCYRLAAEARDLDRRLTCLAEWLGRLLKR